MYYGPKPFRPFPKGYPATVTDGSGPTFFRANCTVVDSQDHQVVVEVTEVTIKSHHGHDPKEGDYMRVDNDRNAIRLGHTKPSPRGWH